MGYNSLILKLKLAGVKFDAGLSEQEFNQIESTFGFHFPSEIREFYTCAFPVSSGFFNWRDLSPANIQRFHHFYDSMEKSFLFDIEHNALQEPLGARYNEISDQEKLFSDVMAYVKRSPKLIPFYAHRCFFDGMDAMPIVSFWQPTDTIFYGGNFENYLEVEFLGKKRVLENIPERMKATGIWAELIG